MLRNGYTLSLTPAMYSPWISNRLIANEYKNNMCVFLNSVPPKEGKLNQLPFAVISGNQNHVLQAIKNRIKK